MSRKRKEKYFKYAIRIFKTIRENRPITFSYKEFVPSNIIIRHVIRYDFEVNKYRVKKVKDYGHNGTITESLSMSKKELIDLLIGGMQRYNRRYIFDDMPMNKSIKTDIILGAILKKTIERNLLFLNASRLFEKFYGDAI